MALKKVQEIATSSPVVIFSKTYCGYCQRAKQLFTQLQAAYKALELDELGDGQEMQSALVEWTEHRTVPNIFIGGKHIGGCDSVLEKYQDGSLLPLLMDAGAIPKDPSKVQVV